MAASKAKRSARTAQPTPTAKRKHSGRASRPNRNITCFPEARGKIVKDIEFYTGSDSTALALRFQDNTSLAFDFATGFATEAHFSRWKDGNERVLRYWPRIQSEPVF